MDILSFTIGVSLALVIGLWLGEVLGNKIVKAIDYYFENKPH